MKDTVLGNIRFSAEKKDSLLQDCILDIPDFFSARNKTMEQASLVLHPKPPALFAKKS